MTQTRTTPVILTRDEEPNIRRTLESLVAFPRVVVVDSDSTDGTEAIARSFENVSWFVNRFEGHVQQWRWALGQTEISTPFVLALDADMSVTPELVAEIELVSADDDVGAALIPVEYRIRGASLLGSLYPDELRLLRRSAATVTAAGHTQKFATNGRVVKLRNRLVHDDRKSLEAFVNAQLGYSARELPCLYGRKQGTFAARARRSVPFTPLAVWGWAWLRAGGPFRGAAARRYALERLIYEAMLRWRVEDQLMGSGEAGRFKGSDRRDTPEARGGEE